MASQLSLIGEQDVILSGNPTHTLWSSMWKRSTLFSMENIQQPFNGQAQIGTRCNVNISKNGDLLHNVFLQMKLPDLRDFSINKQAVALQNTPVIISSRWTSSTQAKVKFLAPTDNASSEFSVSVKDVNGNDITGQLSISDGGLHEKIIDGLVAPNTYTTTIVRDVDGAVSSEEKIVALRYANAIGNASIKKVSLNIGGTMITESSGEYFDIQSELEMSEEKLQGYNAMICKYANYDLYDNSKQDAGTIFAPILFSFFKEPSSALPLISLAFHQIQLFFDFRSIFELIRSDVEVINLVDVNGRTPEQVMEMEMYATFVYLSQPERQRFLQANQKLEYIFHDVQSVEVPLIVNQSNANLNKKINFSFTNPCQELIWIYRRNNAYNNAISPSEYATKGNDFFNYSLDGREIFDSAQIQINGVDRQSKRHQNYYRLMEPFLRHTRVPVDKDIFCFSFGLSPELLQPSGSLNLSRVERADLILTLSSAFTEAIHSGKITLFAKTLNILRIENGLAGTLFAA